jgi:hypothetical protein
VERKDLSDRTTAILDLSRALLTAGHRPELPVASQLAGFAVASNSIPFDGVVSKNRQRLFVSPRRRLHGLIAAHAMLGGHDMASSAAWAIA